MDLVHDRGSMDPVHESGPWTRSKVGVHGPLVHVLSSPFAKAESPSYHRKQCVNRECDRCDVDKLDLLNGEKDVRSNVPLETWQTT